MSTAKALHISKELQLPLDAATETIGILAVKRAGKSNAAVAIAEEMFDAGIPWVAIDPKGDWWGIRSNAGGTGPGLAVLVFGGLHGDVPLEPTAGRLVADLIVDMRLTCVLDVSEMTKADQRRFLTDFADRLYRRNTEPLHVFCEEADDYIPQMVRGEVAKVVGAFETLVKRGGFRGIGITLISQRSASLNKDVLTQVGTLIPLRTTSPQDRKAILAWIEQHAQAKDVIDQLPSLENGEAWVFSPEWLKTLTKIRFRRRRTFDSGATPTVGRRTARPPVTVADVDLARIKEQMAETIERAKADDPRELRRRIAQLERQLAETNKAKPEPEVRVERVEVPVLDEKLVARIEKALDPAASLLAEAQETLLRHRLVFEKRPTRRELPPSPAERRPAQTPTTPRRPERSPPPVEGDVKIGKGERTVLGVLAQWPQGRTYNELAFLAGYSAKASTLGVILSTLRKAGYVAPGNNPVLLTDEGLDAAGGAQPLPTGQELLDHWLRHPRMGEGERRVLLALIDRYPDDLSHDELCEITGYSPVASTMGVILSKLRKLGLVEKKARQAASEFMQSIS